MTRHETRECAFYLLFESLFQEGSVDALYEVAADADVFEVTADVKQMTQGVLDNATLLDKIISAYSPKRVLNRIPKINLTILRLALYEILFDANMPVNAAVSEAVALTKAYAYQEDIAFVNGILGNFVREFDLHQAHDKTAVIAEIQENFGVPAMDEDTVNV